MDASCLISALKNIKAGTVLKLLIKVIVVVVEREVHEHVPEHRHVIRRIHWLIDSVQRQQRLEGMMI